MAQSDLAILLVGSTFRAEFRAARAVLDRLSRVVPAMDASTAAAAIESGRIAPDLIVVAQAFPGQFSIQAIDRLRRLAPMSPVIGLMGSWCEGEMRTGDPWPGTTRLYWHQWPEGCSRELARLGEGGCSSWGLPATASDEEHLLAMIGDLDGERRGPGRREQIVVRSPLFDMQDWLAAACRTRGYRTEWLRPGQPLVAADPAAVVFDFADSLDAELAELERLTAALPGVPVVAVIGFPRVEDRDRAEAAGAAAVVSKPLLAADLLWQLDDLLNRATPVS